MADLRESRAELHLYGREAMADILITDFRKELIGGEIELLR